MSSARRLTKTSFWLVALLVVGFIIGGLIAGVVDVVAPGLTAGTPLGPDSRIAPFIWATIVLVAIFAYQR